jgi:hypothetical protein
LSPRAHGNQQQSGNDLSGKGECNCILGFHLWVQQGIADMGKGRNDLLSKLAGKNSPSLLFNYHYEDTLIPVGCVIFLMEETTFWKTFKTLSLLTLSHFFVNQ